MTTTLNENDLAAEEVNKLEKLGERIDQYKGQLMEQMQFFIDKHEYYLSLIERSGYNDPEADHILLGPALLAKIREWYELASVEAFAISGKSRDLQKFYLATAEQGKAAQYERVRLRQYHKDMNSATDAKEVARRVGGRLEEKAAYYEGEYLRWHGAGEGYKGAANSTKDMYELAKIEWQLTRNT